MLGLTTTEIGMILIGVLSIIYVYKKDIDIPTEEYKERLTELFYSDSMELLLPVSLLVGDKITMFLWDVGFATMEKWTQFYIIGFVLAFTIVGLIGYAEKVIRMIYTPKWKAILNLEPQHEGNFDVLIGQEDTVDDEFDVKGADKLHEKPAGPNGQANVGIARKIDHAKGIAVASWRALYDVLELEEKENLIETNNYLIENELDEAREVKRRNLIHKHKNKKAAEKTIQDMWDGEYNRDGETTHEEIQNQTYDGYDPHEFDEQGVKEKAREDIDGEKAEELKKQEELAENIGQDESTDTSGNNGGDE